MMYFDYASTTPVHEQVLKTYTGLLETCYGNPDSTHPIGVEASRLLAQSREHIARLLGIKQNEILFTSGASESNNLGVKGIALQYQHRGKHLITSNAEHASVLHAFAQLEQLFGFDVTYLPVNKAGVVTLEQVQNAVREDTILISLIYVNNELGSINPIEQIGQWIHTNTRVYFHSDFVQAAGKHDLPMRFVDLATISAHKMYGLKGSGLLIKKENVQLQPLIGGGDQEFGQRAGTSNAPVNIVFAKTLRLALECQSAYIMHARQLRDVLAQEWKDCIDIVYNSTLDASPFIVNVRTPLGSEIMMNALAKAGYCISAKSTCSTKVAVPSHALLAIGLSNEEALRSIRISFGKDSKVDEVRALGRIIKDIIERYRT